MDKEEILVEEEDLEELAAEEDSDTDGDTEGDSPDEEKSAESKGSAGTLKDVWKQVFGQALNVALQGRGNVVMVRVNDEALQYLDMLVEAEVTKSRSESAALLINEGISANQDLFNRIGEITQQIVDLRAQLRQEVQSEIRTK